MRKCHHPQERLEKIIRDHEGVWKLFRCTRCGMGRKEAVEGEI